jgi:CDP-2,3-bis-(O-geranylgeranyl)-sn-glycerol synthase
MFPVYMANNCATLFGGGMPIDGGKYFYDGKRILGDNKTYRGFILGTLGGIIVGVLLAMLYPIITPYLMQWFNIGPLQTPSPAIIIALPLGALIGDSVKSFFKRRMGMPGGSMLPIADQLDFVIGSWVLGFIADATWFTGSFTISIMITVIIITFPLQLFHNAIAVGLGKKKVPW